MTKPKSLKKIKKQKKLRKESKLNHIIEQLAQALDKLRTVQESLNRIESRRTVNSFQELRDLAGVEGPTKDAITANDEKQSSPIRKTVPMDTRSMGANQELVDNVKA